MHYNDLHKLQTCITFSVELKQNKHSEFITELFLIELGGVHFYLHQEKEHASTIDFTLFFDPSEEKQAKTIESKIKNKVEVLNNEKNSFKFW